MKTIPSILALAVLSAFATGRGAESTPDLAGQWIGTLDAGAMKLRVAFHISPAAGGKFTATMDSLDQGAFGIPVDSVTVTGTSLRLEVKKVTGVYEGTLEPETATVSGTWTQGPNVLPLNLAKAPADGMATEEVLSPADREANREAALKLAGVWSGTLATGGPGLRLRVKVAKTPAGAAAGTMDSLDQNAHGIPLSAITLSEGKVRFDVRAVGGVYEGTLAADGVTLNGTWSQRGNTMPLDLQKAKSE